MFYSNKTHSDVGRLFKAVEDAFGIIGKHLNGLTDAQIEEINKSLLKTLWKTQGGAIYRLDMPIPDDAFRRGRTEMSMELDLNEKRFRVVEILTDANNIPVTKNEIVLASVSKGCFHMKFIDNDCEFLFDSVAKTGKAAQRGFDVTCTGRNMFNDKTIVCSVGYMTILMRTLAEELNVLAENIGMNSKIVFPDVKHSFAEKKPGIVSELFRR